MDPVEEISGVKLEEASPVQLLTYFERGKSYVLGVEVAPEGLRARRIFESFFEKYGPEASREIVRYAVLEKKCKYKGEYLTAYSFHKNASWITDGLYTELQMKEQSESNKTERDQELKSKFASLKDL